jgi:HK97 family phage prohead protease
MLLHKTAPTATETTTDRGEFTALAAAYTVDRANEQIRRGAFQKTIARWQAADRPLPLHWDHQAEPESIIGVIDPASLRETDEGLFVKGHLDLEGSAKAREVWRLVKAGSVALSFGYLVEDSVKRDDGVRELRSLDLFEVSIVAAPANPSTRVLSTKAATASDPGSERVWAAITAAFNWPREQISAKASEAELKARTAEVIGAPIRFETFDA